MLAGDYDVFVGRARRRWRARSTVRLGRQTTPMETWSLAGRQPGFTGLTLALPALAHSITITGDDAARAVGRPADAQAADVASAANARASLRAARFGRVVVFALDDNAYLEPTALWVRGERTARFVVRADAARAAVLRVAGGPVANDGAPSRAARGAPTVTLAPGASGGRAAAADGAGAGRARRDERHRVPPVDTMPAATTGAGWAST